MDMQNYLHPVSNKTWRRAAYLLVIATLLIIMSGQAVSVQASTYFVKHGVPVIPPSYCNATSNKIQGTFTQNTLAGQKYSMVATIAGTVYPPATGTYSTGSVTGTYWWQLFYAAKPFPYDVQWAFKLTQSDGTPITSSVISFTCASPGTITNLVVTNTDLTITPTPTAAVEFWNPNDGRVDPHAADRLAVWCNQSDKVIVYGVADDVAQPMNGFYLASFSYKALLAAGDNGLTVNAGRDGVVSASIRNGWFWIAWNGGHYKATGQDTFVKNFEDNAWCSAAHSAQ